MSVFGRGNGEDVAIAAQLASIGHPQLTPSTAGDGAEALDPREFLSHDIGRIRIRALGALARVGELTSADLIGALADADLSVALKAARLTARLDGPEPIGAVISQLTRILAEDSAPAELQEACAFALGELLGADRSENPATAGSTTAPSTTALVDEVERGRAIGALTAQARSHADSMCREAAVAALGSIGDPASLETLLDSLHDRAYVRRRGVIALAAYQGLEVEAALAAALDDRDWQVRDIAGALQPEPPEPPENPDPADR